MTNNPHFVKQDFCPQCGKLSDSAAPLEGVHIKPECGDLCICLACSKLNIFNEDLTLTPFDWSAMTVEGKQELLEQLKRAYKNVDVRVQ